MYVCLCVHTCVCEREKEKERQQVRRRFAVSGQMYFLHAEQQEQEARCGQGFSNILVSHLRIPRRSTDRF